MFSLRNVQTDLFHLKLYTSLFTCIQVHRAIGGTTEPFLCIFE